ncbi:pyridoxamine 5'-phosphate oxidase-domain-containing protein [Peziza echinospora]|nr:pyridoxamine 5'-phosphate oxidase-domain-containing protein [Peziza echinospora]
MGGWVGGKDMIELREDQKRAKWRVCACGVCFDGRVLVAGRSYILDNPPLPGVYPVLSFLPSPVCILLLLLHIDIDIYFTYTVISISTMARLTSALLAFCLASFTLANPLPPNHPAVAAGTPNPHHPADYHIPTVAEAAYSARLLLLSETLGTLSTVFPTDNEKPLSGYPIGLIDYYADCSSSVKPATSTPGNPTVLNVSIATTFRNTGKGSPISLSINAPIPAGTRSPASLPRLVVLGHLKNLGGDQPELKECFTSRHGDSNGWTPGGRIHQSQWAEIDVEGVYWVGGFGDRAYIGWIPLDLWRGVELKEEDVRMALAEKEEESKVSGYRSQGGALRVQHN